MTNAANLTAAVIRQLTAPQAVNPDDLTTARAFERWRIARAPLAPMNELLLLAYLIDKPRWAWSTTRATTQKLNRYYRSTTGAPLSGELVTGYIARRRTTARAPLTPVAPLRTDDARRIATALDANEPPAPVAAMRAGLEILRSSTDLDQPLRECWNVITTLHLHATPQGHQLRTSHAQHVANLTSEDATSWRQHLTFLTNADGVRTRSRSAAKRAGIDPDASAATLTDQQWDWYWRALDPTLARQLRDRAYYLVGLAAARRHAELGRLTIDKTHIHPDGVTARFWDGKRRAWLSYDIQHPGNSDTPCPAECAACALEDRLAWLRECKHQDTGIVFATTYGKTTNTMSRQNARLRLRNLTGLIADRPWGSTRSLRAGAATSAYERGMSVRQIASDVTKHDTINQARDYIRKTGAAGDTLQLRLSTTQP